MRAPVVVILVLAMVAGVAITGSRARPVAGAVGPGFAICQPNGPRVLDSARCRPIVTVAASLAEFEREFGDYGRTDYGTDYDVGGDDGDPDWLANAVKAVVDVAWKAFLGEMVERFVDWAFGDGVVAAGTAPNEPTIFDPVP